MEDIYDFLSSSNIVEYWINKNVNRTPYLGEILFPAVREISVRLEWIKGATGLPVALKTSAYDSKVTKRDREGFELNSAKMPFFKEAMDIDEEMLERLRELMYTNNSQVIDRILSKIFNDQIKLIDAAYERLEVMRMQALTTGQINLEGNGTEYTFDFLMPEDNKKTVKVSWSDPNADIIKDIEDVKLYMRGNGVILKYIICNSAVISNIMSNTKIKNSIYVLGNGNVDITLGSAIKYIEGATGLSIIVQDNVYAEGSGTNITYKKYFADDVAVFIPDGTLGQTHFGVTPEEQLANSEPGKLDVQVINDGITLSTYSTIDPVATTNKVSMVALPSFDRADEVVILDLSTAD